MKTPPKGYFCPKCGMDRGDVIQGWRCGSIAHWENGSLQIQSAACAEIERLKAKIKQLEHYLEAKP